MDIKTVQDKLNTSLADISNDTKAAEYVDALSKYLKEKKITNEIIPVIVQGMDIDHGSNFADYITELTTKDLKSIWKTITDGKELDKCKKSNTLKFLVAVFFLGMTREGKVWDILDAVINCIAQFFEKDTQSKSSKLYNAVFKDYFLTELPEGYEYPGWSAIKAKLGNITIFTNKMLEVISEDTEPSSLKCREWLIKGIEFVEIETDRKKYKDKVPGSKIDDLKTILEHYKKVEDNFRALADETFQLSQQLKEQKKAYDNLTLEKMQLEKEIKSLSNCVEEMQSKVDAAEEEVEARKKINDAADALNENDKEAMLRDIASALSAEYKDFIETANDEMDLMLGEIYQEKLKNIFKILENKGIRME